MISCAFCGRPNTDDSRFCIDCGKPVGSKAAAVVPPTPAPAAFESAFAQERAAAVISQHCASFGRRACYRHRPTYAGQHVGRDAYRGVRMVRESRQSVAAVLRALRTPLGLGPNGGQVMRVVRGGGARVGHVLQRLRDADGAASLGRRARDAHPGVLGQAAGDYRTQVVGAGRSGRRQADGADHAHGDVRWARGVRHRISRGRVPVAGARADRDARRHAHGARSRVAQRTWVFVDTPYTAAATAT